MGYVWVKIWVTFGSEMTAGVGSYPQLCAISGDEEAVAVQRVAAVRSYKQLDGRDL